MTRHIPPPLLIGYVEEHGPVDTMTAAAAFGVSRKVMLGRMALLAAYGHVERIDRILPLLGRASPIRWGLPAELPEIPECHPDEGPDRSPMRQRLRSAGTWESVAPGARPAGFFDGLTP